MVVSANHKWTVRITSLNSLLTGCHVLFISSRPKSTMRWCRRRVRARNQFENLGLEPADLLGIAARFDS